MHKVQEVVEALLYKLASYSQDTKEYEFYVKLESNISFNALQQVLKNILNSEEKDTLKLLEPLMTFYADRWDHIKKTDAIYPHTPNTRINLASLMVARSISTLSGKHPYEILMPTLQCKNYYFQGKGNLGCLELHDFILGDDGNPIGVLESLMMNENQKKSDRNQSKVFYKKEANNGQTKKMTCLEQLRLVNHSDYVQDYCLMLNGCENINIYKNKLFDAFAKKDYVVTASYGKDGTRNLKKSLFKDVKSAQELADLMITHLTNKKEWQHFLSSAPSEDLCRILLNIDSHELESKCATPQEFEKALLEVADIELNKIVQKNLGLVYTDEQIRARISCLLEIYKRARNIAPETRSNTGYYASYVMPSWMSGSFNKSAKLNSCVVFGDFLMSDPPHPLNDLEGYLKERDLHKDHWGPLTVNPYFFGVSTLVKLVQITTDAGKKMVEQAQEGKVCCKN